MKIRNFFFRGSASTVSLMVTVVGMSQAASPSNTPAEHLWKPVPDQVYLQEVGSQIRTDHPVNCVGIYSNIIFVVEADKLMRVEEDHLVPDPDAPKQVHRLKKLGDAVWALTESGLYRFNGKSWQQIDSQKFVDLCLHLGTVHGATQNALFALKNDRFVNLRPEGGYLSTDTTLVMEDFSQVLADPVEIGPVQRIASYSGTLYVLRPGRLALIEGKTFSTDTIDFGALASPNTRNFLAAGSRLFIATDRGVGVLRGMAITNLRGSDGLPYEDTTCLAQGFDSDLWIGTSRGAIRKTGDDYHFFGEKNWLPGEKVNDIAVQDRLVCIGTDKGLGIIRYEPFTLENKVAFFEREMGEWGFKRLGFVHKLFWGGDQAGWLREISDNDGGNTSHYLAAMSFKYAVTGSGQARQEAVDAFKSMVWLGDITGKPGFIARAIWSVKGDKGEKSTRGSGGLPAKWYPTSDGLWMWKGDTSSDEVNAHFYSVSLFHDLAAQGAEKARARRHLADISSHIITNGWVLRDMDGKPTRWGRWDPEYLLRPYGFESRGLNGMEAQTYMQTAYALTGDEKFQNGLAQLLKWRYHTYTVRQRITFPPDQIAPWDDELAFFCYHTLLRYAKDPELRSIYLRSLDRTWEILRLHQLPFFNFTYGALTGNDCEAAQAVNHLRQWSLDVVNRGYHNSHRCDLGPQPGYVPYGAHARAISPRETEAKWGDRWPFDLDSDANGHSVTPPVGWIEEYWMGRYYGFIQPPSTNPASQFPLVTHTSPRQFAAPYSGPPRPDSN